MPTTDKDPIVNYDKLAKKVEDMLIKDRTLVTRNSPKILWSSFTRGVAFGMGTVVGATLLVMLVGMLVARFGGVPGIGRFLENFGHSLTTTY